MTFACRWVIQNEPGIAYQERLTKPGLAPASLQTDCKNMTGKGACLGLVRASKEFRPRVAAAVSPLPLLTKRPVCRRICNALSGVPRALGIPDRRVTAGQKSRTYIHERNRSIAILDSVRLNSVRLELWRVYDGMNQRSESSSVGFHVLYGVSYGLLIRETKFSPECVRQHF
jgi:hypothetical protein